MAASCPEPSLQSESALVMNVKPLQLGQHGTPQKAEALQKV